MIGLWPLATAAPWLLLIAFFAAIWWEMEERR